MSAHTHSCGIIYVPPVMIQRGAFLRIPAGPPKNRAAMLARFVSREAYEAALLLAKKERRQHRQAEAIMLRKLVSASEQVSLNEFKAECEALLDNLRAMPYGTPKTPEQMHLDLARFAERWFRRGQQKPVVNAPIAAVSDPPPIEVIPAVRGPVEPITRQFVPPTEDQGGRAANPASFAQMEFTQAAGVWLQRQRIRLRPSSVERYVQHIKMLAVYFGGIRLDEIHSGHLPEYQNCRTYNLSGAWFTATGGMTTPWERPSGHSNTNHELSTLSQILRMAKLWKHLSDDYKPIPPSGFKKPKVMTNEEKRKFYATAASRPEWMLVLGVAAITNHTTASGTELRNLTFGDVFLGAEKPHIQVNPDTAKCRSRGREVYLDPTAHARLKRAMDRARTLGANRPEHYVFPFRVARNRYDVTRPASRFWIRAAWDGLREAAGIDWITPHCLRHQCLTEMMEVGVPPEQMRKIAGHLSPEMTEHYTHNRLHKQAEALDKLEPILEVL